MCIMNAKSYLHCNGTYSDLCYVTAEGRHRIHDPQSCDKDKYTGRNAKLDQWEVYSNQLAVQSRLGEGAFGDVYQGMFNSTITEKSNVKKFDVNNSVEVAVKMRRGQYGV